MVGIALATFNGSKYIHQLLSSLNEQSYSNFHIHICDDGSTDNTIDLILKSEVYQSGRVSIHCTNGGNGAMRNFKRVIEFCNESYIALCDQDDYWHPEKLKVLLDKVVETESQYPNLPVLSFSDLEIVDSELKQLNKSFFDDSLKNSKCSKPQDFIVNNHVPGCAMMFNSVSKVFFQPIPDNVRMHDWWLIFIISIYGKVSFTNKSLIKYRQHSSNTVGVPGIKNNSTLSREFRALKDIIKGLKKSSLMKNNILSWVDSHPQLIPTEDGKYFLKNINRGLLGKFRLYHSSFSGEPVLFSILIWCGL